jgi:hypothetical protein
MPAKDEIMGFLTGHPTWTGTPAISTARQNPGLPANAIAQLVQASGVGEGNEGRANYLPQKARAIATMKAQGLAAGGSATAKKLHEVSKALHRGIHNIRKGHAPLGYSGIHKGVRELGKVEGLSPRMIQKLVEDTEQVETYSEYAQNASGLNSNEESGEESKTVFGLFQGKDEGYWLVTELESLQTLRNQLLSARKAIKRPQNVINKMVKRFKTAMHMAEKHVRELKRKEKELEKEKEEIEKAEKLGLRKLEKEKTEWEHTLRHLKQAKDANKEPIHGQVVAAQGKIKILNNALHDTQSKAGTTLKEENKKLQAVKKALGGREKEVSGYQKFVPELESKREALGETSKGIESGYSVASGPYRGKSWEGLRETQGRIHNYNRVPLPHLPTGGWGGNILTVQEAIKAYGEVNKPPKSGQGQGAGAVAEDLKNVKGELEMSWKKKYIASQAQMAVLASFPSVRATAAVPYVGARALGGAVATTVGERGTELAVMPNGSHVLSHYDAMHALDRSNQLVIEHMVIESDGSVRITTPEDQFEARVKKVTRKQARRGARSSPGSR